MALPTMATGKVIGQFLVGDGSTAAVQAAQGIVIFTAAVPTVPNPSGGFTLVNYEIVGVLDEEGWVCTPLKSDPSKPGTRGINLAATNASGVGVQDWTWTVTSRFEALPGSRIVPHIIPFSFDVPAGVTTDLAKVAKVPNTEGTGNDYILVLAREEAKTAAKDAVGAEIKNRDLIEGSDNRIPANEDIPGLAVTVTDSRGNRTRLEANDTDGGPTAHALSLEGPALRDYMDFVTGEDPRIPSNDAVSGVSLAMVDAAGRSLWLQANDTDGGPTPHAVKMLSEALGVAGAATTTYIADGDSITQGGHGGGTPSNWPAHLATLLGKPVINRGRSGTTGVEIAMRQGGLTPVLTIRGGVLPADTTTAVLVDRVHPTDDAGGYTGSPTHGARTYSGTFDGIPAELVENTDDTWTLRRTVAGTTAYAAVPRTPFIIDGLDPKATRIFWPGRNDVPKTQVLANVDHMAKWTTDNGGRFLVVSILTRSGAPETWSDNVEIRAVNEQLQAKYPRNFVNMRDYLVNYGVAAAGLTPTQEDRDATAGGGIPPSLMADALHPNAAGRIAIAKYIHQQLKARDWA